MTELRERVGRTQRHAVAGQMGMPMGDAYYGVFALHPRAVAEMASLPSAIVAGQLPTTQRANGTLPWMAEVDGLDSAGLG